MRSSRPPSASSVTSVRQSIEAPKWPPRTRVASDEYAPYVRARSSRRTWKRRDDAPPPSDWFATTAAGKRGLLRASAGRAKRRFVWTDPGRFTRWIVKPSDARRRRHGRRRLARAGAEAAEGARGRRDEGVGIGRAREDERRSRKREPASREVRDVVAREREEALLARRDGPVRVAGVEPVVEPLAGEEVRLRALLLERRDEAAAALVELLLGERRLGQDLGEEREPGVEVALEDVEARDGRVAAGGDLRDGGEVVERLGELARRLRARSAEERVARDVGGPLAAGRIGRRSRAREEDRGRDRGTAAPARRAHGEPGRQDRPLEAGQDEGQRRARGRREAARAHAASRGRTATTERRAATSQRSTASRTCSASTERTSSRSRRQRPGSPS